MDVVLFPGPRPQLPIEGPWRQASLKSFLKNVDAGKEETGNGHLLVDVLILRGTLGLSIWLFSLQAVRWTVRLTA